MPPRKTRLPISRDSGFRGGFLGRYPDEVFAADQPAVRSRSLQHGNALSLLDQEIRRRYAAGQVQVSIGVDILNGASEPVAFAEQLYSGAGMMT